jgi:hypothetical protein
MSARGQSHRRTKGEGTNRPEKIENYNGNFASLELTQGNWKTGISVYHLNPLAGYESLQTP